MPAGKRQHGFFPAEKVHGILRLRDRRRGLDGAAEKHRHPGRYAAQDPAVMIALRHDVSRAVQAVGIVRAASFFGGKAEAEAELYAFDPAK